MGYRSIAGWLGAGLLLYAAIACAQAMPDLGFTTRVSAGLTTQYGRKFGPAVPERFSRWMGFAREQKGSPLPQRLESAKGREAGALQVINDAINGQVKWVDDKTHWGVDDYWATPAESIASAGGDCEDFSIAKYYLLKELGVPIERLRITYVRALKLSGQAHMVLVYYASPEAEPLILDNLDPVIRGASQRGDLEPVYSFNDDEVQMVQGGKRGKPSQIRAWLAVQERLLAEART
jgi:predicted transglutaminase-like cysteine proteinase